MNVTVFWLYRFIFQVLSWFHESLYHFQRSFEVLLVIFQILLACSFFFPAQGIGGCNIKS